MAIEIMGIQIGSYGYSGQRPGNVSIGHAAPHTRNWAGVNLGSVPQSVNALNAIAAELRYVESYRQQVARTAEEYWRIAHLQGSPGRKGGERLQGLINRHQTELRKRVEQLTAAYRREEARVRAKSRRAAEQQRRADRAGDRR